jgi:splicing factor 3B subunit 3
VRLIDPRAGSTLDVLELPDNEAGFSIACLAFRDGGAAVGGRGPEALLVVGTAKDLKYHPRSLACGFLHVLRVTPERKLERVHATPVEDVPTALCAFHGRLLAGVGNRVRLFELGRRKLLRKGELRGLPTTVATLHASGERIFVGDAQDSVLVALWRRADNTFSLLADDPVARHVTALLPVDADTVVGADKFGSVWALRLPPAARDASDASSGSRLWDAGALNGAPHKLESLVSFHVGDMVTSLARTVLAGGEEVIVYGTVGGALGLLAPLRTKADVDFFTHLEMYLRAAAPSPLGRDHLAFRSALLPVQRVLDGDLCETFGRLPAATARKVAADLEKPAHEVARRLEERRGRLA